MTGNITTINTNKNIKCTIECAKLNDTADSVHISVKVDQGAQKTTRVFSYQVKDSPVISEDVKSDYLSLHDAEAHYDVQENDIIAYFRSQTTNDITFKVKGKSVRQLNISAGDTQRTNFVKDTRFIREKGIIAYVDFDPQHLVVKVASFNKKVPFKEFQRCEIEDIKYRSPNIFMIKGTNEFIIYNIPLRTFFYHKSRMPLLISKEKDMQNNQSF